MALDYDEIEVSNCNNRGVFADLLIRQAARRTVKILWIGNSLSTRGTLFMQSLVRQVQAHYGNVPGLELAVGDYSADGWPIMAYTFASHGSITTTARLASTYIFPSYSSLSIRGSLGAEDGQLWTMDHVGTNALDERFRIGQFIRNTDDWVLDIYAATNASSGEIHWKSIPGASKNLAWNAATNSGNTEMGLESGTVAIKKATTDVLQLDTGRVWQAARLYGTDAVKYTDLVGVMPRNVTNPQGLLIQPFAGGGARITQAGAPQDLMGSAYANVGQLVAQFDPDIVVVQSQINEGKADLTAAQYGALYDGASGLVNKVRVTWGLTDIPIIAISEPFSKDPLTTGDPMPTQVEVDKYPGELDARVAQYANFWHINLRLLAEQHGYNDANLSHFTVSSGTDVGTHPNEDGAWLMSNLIFGTVRKELSRYIEAPGEGVIVG